MDDPYNDGHGSNHVYHDHPAYCDAVLYDDAAAADEG